MEMIKTVLENNNFSFGDKKYLQKDGVAQRKHMRHAHPYENKQNFEKRKIMFL